MAALRDISNKSTITPLASQIKHNNKLEDNMEDIEEEKCMNCFRCLETSKQKEIFIYFCISVHGGAEYVSKFTQTIQPLGRWHGTAYYVYHMVRKIEIESIFNYSH